MKNLLKNSLLIAVLFTTAISAAMSEDPRVVINSSEEKLVNLTLNNFDGNIQLYIKDNQGIVLYKESVNNSDFSKKYDLTQLPDGNYYFEIDSYTKLKRIPVSVVNNKVVLVEEEKQIQYKPIVRVNNNEVFISKLALNKESLKIELFDSKSNLLFTEELQGEINLERKLNLSKLEKGNYELHLTSEGKKTIKAINNN